MVSLGVTVKARPVALHAWVEVDGVPEPVKVFWTLSSQLFCSWVGSVGGLIQAVVGSLGGSGSRLNRSGLRA